MEKRSGDLSGYGVAFCPYCGGRRTAKFFCLDCDRLFTEEEAVERLKIEAEKKRVTEEPENTNVSATRNDGKSSGSGAAAVIGAIVIALIVWFIISNLRLEVKITGTGTITVTETVKPKR